MNSTKYVFRSVVVLYAFLITFSINSPTLLGQSCNAYEVVADINVKTIDIDPYPRYLIDLSLTLSRSVTLFKRIEL